MKRARKKTLSAIAPTLLALTLVTFVLASTEGCKTTRRGFYNLFHHRKAKSKSNSTDFADNVEQVVSSPKLAIMKWSDFADEQPLVQTFYDDRNFELAWTRDGKPTSQTTALIAAFTSAAQKGLNPDDYDASRWPQRLTRLEEIRKAKDTSDNAQTVIAQFDAAMTISAMRFLSDLHCGRVNPQSLNFDIDVPAKRAAFDLPGFLNDQLVDADDVPTTIGSIEPQSDMYAATEKALAQYLMLAAEPQEPPLPSIVKPITVGGDYPALPALLTRLQLEGNAGSSTPPTSYDAALAAAVGHFQQRHGLTADGKLTPQTIDAMNVPLAQRIQQFNLALERWRWLPDNFVNSRVVVNLPEFLVRTYDENHTLAFKMRVVDGEAEGGHDTPMFVRTMRYVNFRPYWNLPTSIVKKELMRHVNAGGAGYLESHDYEITDSSGNIVTSWTPAELERGHFLVRQRPGPKNSLGLVKFMFPNEYDVYMHSTPEMNLFNLTRRDRSHGCIRLNDAEAMANWVLQGQGDWDAAKIHDAMFGDNNNRQVNLKTPLPVNITYLTANADEDGTVHFFNDIYGYDAQLKAALDKGRPYDRSEHKINPHLTPGETE